MNDLSVPHPARDNTCASVSQLNNVFLPILFQNNVHATRYKEQNFLTGGVSLPVVRVVDNTKCAH